MIFTMKIYVYIEIVLNESCRLNMIAIFIVLHLFIIVELSTIMVGGEIGG